MRKRQLPVEQAVILGDPPRGLDEHRGRRRLPVAEREPQGRRRRGLDDRAGFVLGPKEGGAPRVGHELLVLVGLRRQERLPLSLLLGQAAASVVRGPLDRAHRIANVPVSLRGSNGKPRCPAFSSRLRRLSAG